MRDVRYHYKENKTAIRKQDLADFFTISKYSFSPYRACEHGCLYCDGRAEKYYVEGEFDKDIVIRQNIPELLESEIVKLRERAFICIGSGVSDVYQPIEREEGLMRRCAEVLVKHEFPVVVLTKSSLVLRDLDLWAELNRKSKFLLLVSVTTTDDSLRKTFEPGASGVEQRFETIKQFKAAGCSVGVLAMPLLPYITETADNMSTLAIAVKNTGADFCMPGGLTLRPGVQKETFMSLLRTTFPQYVSHYRDIYSQNRASGAQERKWHKVIQPYYTNMIQLTSLPPVIPHHIFRGFVPVYEEVFLVLSLMKVAYEYKAVNTWRLQKAMDRYRSWISGIRRPIVRARNRSLDEVDMALESVCNDGTIGSILGNEKLGVFIKKIVCDRFEMNFGTLRLRDD